MLSPTQLQPHAGRIIGSAELTWRAHDDKTFTLHLGRSKALLCVVPDATYSGLWRIVHRGRLSDMVNLSRAKDAAITRALSDLNNRYQETPPEGSPVRLKHGAGS
jgi:hypothetical protein